MSGWLGDAELSPDGVHRFRLERWRDGSREAPYVCWVMLNPSTADAECDDPTIRRCIGFTDWWGYGRLVVVNLSSFRATDPKQLAASGRSHREGNAMAVALAVGEASLVVAAWGATPPGKRGDRALSPRWVAETSPAELHCLGVTKDGSPRHPLYVRADASVEPWERLEP